MRVYFVNSMVYSLIHATPVHSGGHPMFLTSSRNTMWHGSGSPTRFYAVFYFALISKGIKGFSTPEWWSALAEFCYT